MTSDAGNWNRAEEALRLKARLLLMPEFVPPRRGIILSRNAHWLTLPVSSCAGERAGKILRAGWIAEGIGFVLQKKLLSRT